MFMKNKSNQNNKHKQTTIRKKIQIIFTVFFTICISVAILLVTIFIFSIFGDLENKQVNRSLSLIAASFNDRAVIYAANAHDYSVWDETYAFALGEEGGSSSSDSMDSIFSNLSVNLMIIVNTSGDPLYAKMMDYTDGTILDGTADVLRKLSDHNILLNTNPEYIFNGIIMMPDGPMLICSHPILTSEARGPVAGNLFFGRYIDEAMLKDMSENVGFSVSVGVVSKDQFEQVNQMNVGENEPSRQIIVLDDKNIEATLFIQDAFGESVLSFVMQIPRDLHQVAITTLKVLIWGLTVFSIAVFTAMLYYLYKIVIRRITHLQNDVITISDNKDMAKRVSVSRGNDEISYLSNQINKMLDVTDDLYSNIKQANENLDLKVKERTKELLIANEALEVEKAKIQHVAYHDTLTGLPNDLYFKEFLNRELFALCRTEKPLAVMFLDLDGFKMINDSLGHPAGDRLLIDVSIRLSSILRKCDTLARIGGDEFLVMINTVKDLDSIDIIASKILKGIVLYIGQYWNRHFSDRWRHRGGTDKEC
jgi:GGDEF domain-containing protein/sensor domain CHASE-containing protein